MRRHIPVIGLLPLLFALPGCAKEKDYIDAFREQRAAYRDVTQVLATIHDDKSMVDAKASLDLRFAKFAKAAEKIRGLPRPSAELLGKLDQEQAGMKRAFDDLQSEVRRVTKLPGGSAFLKQFDSAGPGLLSAEQP